MDHAFVNWAEIDLDAIAFNVQAIRRQVGPGVEIMPAVKGNAYGHGAAPVSKAALQAGATRLAVHRAIEGGELRQAGIDAPVLVMGYTPPDGAPYIAQHDLTASLMTLEFAQALSAAVGAVGRTLPVHIKVDTGMSRYGLMPDEVLEFARALVKLPNLQLEGLFTHFATADSLDLTHVRRQLAVFNEVLSALHAAGIEIPLPHASNSAAIMRLPEARFKAVRPGIAFYGMPPSDDWTPTFEIHPALTLKSRVCRVRRLPVGAGVSYGRTFVTQRETVAALVPVGYGDGFHRILSNKAQVLIRGKRAPLIGRVCMDQFVVDATEIPGVELNDEVVLVGRQGSEQISAEEVARLAGTINYEVTTSLLPRVARLYLRGGKVVETTAIGE
ncbi:alanine racemase [Longilinea arvoryzae]|uniref:Alanine racemase n=1 Tax=Longilinea arvoryzae TaxID=360412 RepID=A0A0K8MZK0_9CHLR|nr:alanine racemase [Longilinea arvoryzae]GAP16072.1 alanine racemase [Longilinea arvoryzae]